MAVTISPRIDFTAVETLSSGVDAATDPVVSHNGFNLRNVSLNASSTPPVTKTVYREFALSGGSLTIDFTSITGTNGITHDMTGLKLQTVIIKNPAGNASMNIAPGSSNPYAPWGTGNDITIPAGSTFGFYFADTLADVAAGAKTLDITGTGTEEISIGFVFG